MIDAVRQSIEKMHNCHGPADLLQIQQEWFTGCLRRVAPDLEAGVGLTITMWQRTVSEFTEASQNNAAQGQRPSGSIASDARETPMLSTAGSKP